MFNCTVCNQQMNIRTMIPSGQHKIYVDAECLNCGASYTGTLKRMGKPQTGMLADEMEGARIGRGSGPENRDA